MLHFKKSFTINEHFPHCITDHASSLARFPWGIAPVTRQAVLFRVYGGSQAEPSRAVSVCFESSAIPFSPFLSPLSLKVTFLCRSFPVKPRKELVGLLASLSRSQKGPLNDYRSEKGSTTRVWAWTLPPPHSCPLYKLAFERTCGGVDSGREGEDGEWQ